MGEGDSLVILCTPQTVYMDMWLLPKYDAKLVLMLAFNTRVERVDGSRQSFTEGLWGTYVCKETNERECETRPNNGK